MWFVQKAAREPVMSESATRHAGAGNRAPQCQENTYQNQKMDIGRPQRRAWRQNSQHTQRSRGAMPASACGADTVHVHRCRWRVPAPPCCAGDALCGAWKVDEAAEPEPRVYDTQRRIARQQRRYRRRLPSMLIFRAQISDLMPQ